MNDYAKSTATDSERILSRADTAGRSARQARAEAEEDIDRTRAEFQAIAEALEVSPTHEVRAAYTGAFERLTSAEAALSEI